MLEEGFIMLNEMTQFKHTPGPWWNSGLEVGTAPMMLVKVAKVSGSNFEEAKANAQLIATVPELLEALIECLEGVKELNGEYQDGWDDVIEKASLIIKKATE